MRGLPAAETPEPRSAKTCNPEMGIGMALDVAAVADIIMRLGALLLAEPAIAEIDLNPVIVYPQGQGAIALDALVVVR